MVVITSGFLPGGLWLFSEWGLELDAVAGHALAVHTEQDKPAGGLIAVGWNRTRSECHAVTYFCM